MSPLVRRIQAHEWELTKRLRLRALRDPVADLAFLDTVENASAQPDAFWQERTRAAAEGGPHAQFVAIAENGDEYGTATVLPRTDAPRQGLVVGVYVAEGHRGAGTIEALFDACAAWGIAQGYSDLVLEVHVDNARAQRAYARCGFVRTGEITELANGREYVMRRGLPQPTDGSDPLVP
ncbi:N-acetyltransferase [uncultured Microbacterium sp.]|uniref:GNAT family N-acetyltransferase n=1 Tax=uncultured Microbacterium sp. TaxID=191216 RepID=UPI0025E48530|nr:GNAT family N-acetyltransferase [uncultured Microbacterium sp.]